MVSSLEAQQQCDTIRTSNKHTMSTNNIISSFSPSIPNGETIPFRKKGYVFVKVDDGTLSQRDEPTVNTEAGMLKLVEILFTRNLDAVIATGAGNNNTYEAFVLT